MSKATLHLDLHPLAQQGEAIESALTDILDQAEQKRVKAIEIIPGKGSGQLRRRVLKFLQRPEHKNRYKRISIDSKNHGRLFVYMR